MVYSLNSNISSFRQRKWRQKVALDDEKRDRYLENKRDRDRLRYQHKKESPAFMEHRRDILKIHLLKKTEPNIVEPSIPGRFKSQSSFKKAQKKTRTSLPKSNENQKAIVQSLYYELFPEQVPKNKRLHMQRNQVDALVESFYERIDVSQQLPGKRDIKRIKQADGTVKEVQKRIMLLTLTEAFKEFKKLYPDEVIGKSKFFQLKPIYIAYVHDMKHNGCLCKTCENMKLLFCSLRPMLIDDFKETVVKASDVIDSLLCDNCDSKSCEICEGNMNLFKEMFQNVPSDKLVELIQWRQDVYQLKMFTLQLTFQDVMNEFSEKLFDFKVHLEIKKAQSSFFHQCINSPSEEVAVVQIDFAENFKCISQNEIQSAYFNQHTVSIVTVVLWVDRRTYSKVFVMDDRSHSKYCVYACLDLIMKDVKQKFPTVKIVKMFSDGCAGQFKNRWNLSNVVFAQELFGLDMTWDFFAPGHGKGAVDGIGGIVKRAVYQRIMSGEVRVYSAEDFHNCIEKSLSGIVSTLIPDNVIQETESSISQTWKKVKAIPGVTKYFSFKRCNEVMIDASEKALSENSKRFQIV